MISEASKQHRIFIVDEEYLAASILAQLLCDEGLDAHSFGEPLQALEAASLGPPDLLISDVDVPPLSGIEFATRMQAQAPDCKILLFSTHAGTNHMLQASAAAGSGFALLFAPVVLSQLLDQVNRLLDVVV
jgi:DNA-binding NtrC family response regulator